MPFRSKKKQKKQTKLTNQTDVKIQVDRDSKDNNTIIEKLNKESENIYNEGDKDKIILKVIKNVNEKLSPIKKDQFNPCIKRARASANLTPSQSEQTYKPQYDSLKSMEKEVSETEEADQTEAAKIGVTVLGNSKNTLQKTLANASNKFFFKPDKKMGGWRSNQTQKNSNQTEKSNQTQKSNRTPKKTRTPKTRTPKKTPTPRQTRRKKM